MDYGLLRVDIRREVHTALIVALLVTFNVILDFCNICIFFRYSNLKNRRQQQPPLSPSTPSPGNLQNIQKQYLILIKKKEGKKNTHDYINKIQMFQAIDLYIIH